MRAFSLFVVGSILLAACAPAGDGGSTGPSTNATPALVDFPSATLTVGGSELQQAVSVVVRDARGAVIPSASVTWTSDDPSIVEVSGNAATATLTSHAPGTARIRANAGTASSELTVRVLAIRAVTVHQTAASIRTNDSQQFTYTIDVEAGGLQSVRWSSENVAVATVSPQGLVTGISVGTTLIRATASGDPRVASAVSVTVTPGRAVIMSPASMTLWVGDADTLRAAPEVTATQPQTVQWTSDNPAVATVAASGVVTAVSVGVTKVNAVSTADSRIRGSAEVRILPARLVSVTPATSTVSIGGSRTLSAAVTIEPGLSTGVMWRSSDPTIVSVTQAGVVTGVSLGTVNIVALSLADTVRRFAATVTVTPSVLAVNVTPPAVDVFPGETERVVAGVDVQGDLARTVTWRAVNPAIATVNASGDITGVAPGQAIVRAISTADTTKRADVAVTVRSAPVLAISPSRATMARDEQRTFLALVNVDAGVDPSVRWRTSDPTVATVSASGVVRAVAVGSATITVISVADTTRRATSAVSVVPVVHGITLTPQSLGVFLGQFFQLQASVDADPGLSRAVIWRSSSPSIATVSASGVVTAVSVGQSIVTVLSVADTTKRLNSVVTVASQPTTVTITQGDFALNAAQTMQLTAQVTADPGLATTVTWSSTNASVATVSSTGLVTGVANGSAQIVATSRADPSKTARVNVSVVSRLASSWTASRPSGALYEDVLSVVGFSATSSFVVNSVGDVYRWSGSAWTLSARGSQYNTQFLSVHGSSATNVYAVGTNGVIARFDGSAWATMSSGTTRTLLDVFVESNGSTAFASGASGTILRLSGSTWTAMTSGSTESLNGIWSTGGNAVAVGSNGRVLRMVAGAWVTQTVPTSETLYGVSGTTTSNIVAVGTFGTIIRFNGTAWSTQSANGNTSDFYGIDGTTANGGRMYIASDAGLLQLDGTSLTAVSTPYQPRMFATSVDATGSAWVTGQRGSVFRGATGAFTTVNIAPDLLDVWSSSESNAWAVGEFGFIYRWNGSTWTRQTTPTTATINSVWAASATDAFAGGDNGVMLRYNGSTWTSMSLPVSTSVYSIWGSSGNNVFAVTAAGQVLRFNGTSWSISTSVNEALWSVYGVSANEVYATGEQGRAMRFNGTGWTTLPSASSGILAGVWSAGSNNIMTVGADASGASGIALRYDGASWAAQPTGTSRVLTSAWGPTANDVYATGELGTMLRYNGTSWTLMTTGTTDLLWSVTGSPTGVGGAFAVGYNSTIVTGTTASGMFASARMMAASAMNLEPSDQAKRDPRGLGPVPDGAARRSRKGHTRSREAARQRSRAER